MRFLSILLLVSCDMALIGGSSVQLVCNYWCKTLTGAFYCDPIGKCKGDPESPPMEDTDKGDPESPPMEDTDEEDPESPPMEDTDKEDTDSTPMGSCLRKPGNCPPERDECPSNQDSTAPRKCKSDEDCTKAAEDAICCYDVCAEYHVCKLPWVL